MMNLIIFALLACTMFTIGILGGIIISQRSKKEWDANVINTLCDEVQELQAMTPTRNITHVTQVNESVDIDEVVQRVLQHLPKPSSMEETVTIPKYKVEDLGDIEIKKQSKFLNYISESRISTAHVCEALDGNYYVASNDGWIFCREDEFICCTAKGNYHNGAVKGHKFSDAVDAIRFMQEIQYHAREESMIK